MSPVLSRIFLVLSLAGSAVAAAPVPEARPKYAPSTLRMFSHHEFLRKAPAPDFWALAGYYQPQESGAHCSVASAAMVLNALRASMNLSSADELVTQKALLEKAKVLDWKAKVGEGLLKLSVRGVTLQELKTLMTEALAAYGFAGLEVEVLHAEPGDPNLRKKVREILVSNEKSAADFLIANFLQSEFTGDPDGSVGHLSPVAAFDSKTGRVLILDSDRQYYEPYWVTEEVFLKGLGTRDAAANAYRGLLWIRPKKHERRSAK